VSLAAIVLMPLLAGAKSRVAEQLSSAATAGDAAQSRLCAISAAAVLISLLANHLAGWWWLDPAGMERIAQGSGGPRGDRRLGELALR
jgi:divalent metal cation (Fe/Co/Zn/Cd) transporter